MKYSKEGRSHGNCGIYLVSNIDITFAFDQPDHGRNVIVGRRTHDTGNPGLSCDIRRGPEFQQEIHAVEVLDGCGEQERRFTPLHKGSGKGNGLRELFVGSPRSLDEYWERGWPSTI